MSALKDVERVFLENYLLEEDKLARQTLLNMIQGANESIEAYTHRMRYTHEQVTRHFCCDYMSTWQLLDTGADVSLSESKLDVFTVIKVKVRDISPGDEVCIEQQKGHKAVMCATVLAKVDDKGEVPLLITNLRRQQCRLNINALNLVYKSRIVDKPTELYRTLTGLPEGIHPVIHIDRLKPYLDSELRVKAAEEEQKYEIPQEPVMKQERITSAKVIDGVLKFRVKWEGLSIKNSTWMTKEEVDAKVMEVYERKEAYKKARQATTRNPST
ncbi:hypothetical protein Pelo_18430 [Pelomyxa schiedti]|nr:hypothetical protein Pelo_18430 [Pelomyxa schiedti]